jgi:hypothetical protein
MNNTQKLQDYEFTFDNFLELSPSGCEHESGSLQEFYDDNEADFTEEEHELYDVVLGLSQEAMYYYEAELRQEELDEELDQRSYAGARHLS